MELEKIYQIALEAAEDKAVIRIIRNIIESDRLVDSEKTDLIGVMIGAECKKWKPEKSGDPSV